MDNLVDARHQAVTTELDRVGWRTTTIVSPFVGTTCVIDNRFVASAMSIEDLTIIEVYDIDPDDPMEPGDVMSEKTSIVQPLIGVSAVPGDWLVDEPEYSTLRLVSGDNVWLIHQMLELPVLDDSWIELTNEVGDSLNQFRMFRNAESTGLVGLHDGLRKYLIEGLVIDSSDFTELIRISESVRIHPQIEWNV